MINANSSHEERNSAYESLMVLLTTGFKSIIYINSISIIAFLSLLGHLIINQEKTTTNDDILSLLYEPVLCSTFLFSVGIMCGVMSIFFASQSQYRYWNKSKTDKEEEHDEEEGQSILKKFFVMLKSFKTWTILSSFFGLILFIVGVFNFVYRIQ